MKHVQRDELIAMNARAADAMDDLMDAPVDAVAYACLVAIMAMGPGHHREAERQLKDVALARGRDIPVVTSAGALVQQLKSKGARKIALVMPYADALATAVVDYLRAEDFEVCDSVNLRVTDNAEVGRISAAAVLEAAARLNLSGVDVLVLSACVQMPSLDILAEAERRFGLPTTSAAQCTAEAIVAALDAPKLGAAVRQGVGSCAE
jgi:maleate isomerase